jgi:hypothetical protein
LGLLSLVATVGLTLPAAGSRLLDAQSAWTASVSSDLEVIWPNLPLSDNIWPNLFIDNPIDDFNQGDQGDASPYSGDQG